MLIGIRAESLSHPRHTGGPSVQTTPHSVTASTNMSNGGDSEELTCPLCAQGKWVGRHPPYTKGPEETEIACAQRGKLVEIWVTLMNFLYSCLRWGTLLMPYGYVVLGGLKGVSGRGEEAQDRAGGPH